MLCISVRIKHVLNKSETESSAQNIVYANFHLQHTFSENQWKLFASLEVTDIQLAIVDKPTAGFKRQNATIN